MAHSGVQDQLLSTLKVKDQGWNIQLFEDQNKLGEAICSHCKSVCVSAVELGCNHKDEEIYPFCDQCLQQLINSIDNECPIDRHQNPIIIPSRATRRQILKSNNKCG